MGWRWKGGAGAENFVCLSLKEVEGGRGECLCVLSDRISSALLVRL